jgi:hypothetical protein
LKYAVKTYARLDKNFGAARGNGQKEMDEQG